MSTKIKSNYKPTPKATVWKYKTFQKYELRMWGAIHDKTGAGIIKLMKRHQPHFFDRLDKDTRKSALLKIK